MNKTFVSRITPPDELPEPTYWFIFQDSHLLVQETDGSTEIPLLVDVSTLDLPIVRHQYLGYLQHDTQVHCFAAEVAPETTPPAGMAFYHLRRLYGRLTDDSFWLGGRAVQIVAWDRTHQFCGQCGRPTENQAHERSKKCPQCGLVTYPRLAPAIIVSVERDGAAGRELLLARGHRHPPGFYSVLAGFVEPGETLETCVAREVAEEVGIIVKNIRYFGSQPWPFPHSLMLAFTAEYASGDLILEEEEIEDAAWFTADNLPQIPPHISISRQLIDAFVARQKEQT